MIRSGERDSSGLSTPKRKTGGGAGGTDGPPRARKKPKNGKQKKGKTKQVSGKEPLCAPSTSKKTPAASSVSGSAKSSSVRSRAKQERRREAHANALVGVLGSLSRSGKYANYEAAVAVADRAQTYLSVKAKLQDKFDESCFQHSWVAVVGERADQNKPDGICVIKPHQGADFVAQLPVRRFFGVGPKTAERMAKLDIHNGADLRAQSEDFLRQHFGKSAGYLFRASRGVDHREVRADRIRKSVGGERTYGDDLVTDSDLQDAFENIIDIVWNSIEKSGARGRTVTLKAKYVDFRQVTRSHSVDHYVADKNEFAAIGRELLEQIMPVENGVRLLGLTLANLEGAEAADARSTASVHDANQSTFDFD